MHRIRYAGNVYLADDRTAEVLLGYAHALAVRRAVDVVSLAVGEPDGRIGRARLLVGDGIPLAIDRAPEDGPHLDGDLAEPDLEREIQRMTDGLSRLPALRPAPEEDADPTNGLFD